ncbi:hypothetical protein CROQUDRAFT_650532 [Cronartium quercuum f. sp. fusiforme G11]|uniref:Uncharacterized protein n=1 Tax=Cronartium quercuum f. sp. fusiforme G11 TaxID=708437 RepID=A0A9P6TIM9_9BASI|nr:hypothetical protein CROQUDRAFT_650532 [Cronartium quercuum f. sp. fusiforme G11]
MVELYFEQSISNEGQVSYHCVLCGNRSMKNHKDHMRMDAHKARVTAYVARQAERLALTPALNSNTSTTQSQTEARGGSNGHGSASRPSPSQAIIQINSHQSRSPGDELRANLAVRDLSPFERKRGSECYSGNTPHDIINQAYSEEPQHKRHRGEDNGGGLLDGDRDTNPEDFCYEDDETSFPDLLNRIADFTQSSTSNLTTANDPLANVSRLTSFEAIAQKFEINQPNLQSLLQVFQETIPQNRQFALACFMTQNFQQLSHQLSANDRINQATPQTSDSPIANIWKGSESTRSHVRSAIKALMMDPETQAYCTNETDDHTPIILSLENRMLDQLHAESREFKQAHLPLGFENHDNAAGAAVMKLIKEIAKQVRTKFQNSILTQIKDPVEGLAVPNMTSLMGQIVRTGNSKTDHRSNEEIWEATSPEQKERFALMRLVGVHFHSTTFKNRQRSMWNAVDQRLIWMRTLSPEHQVQFSQFVTDTDKLHFDGTRTIDAIQTDTNFELPTPADFLLMVPPAIDSVETN